MLYMFGVNNMDNFKSEFLYITYKINILYKSFTFKYLYVWIITNGHRRISSSLTGICPTSIINPLFPSKIF